jgi:dolichol-phosphate mannosyltransferase
MKISIIIPTYNEADNISKLIEEILKIPLSINVIIVDDNSPDNTAKIVENLSNKDQRICLIKRAKKLGIGTAYIVGFKEALRQGSDKIITMDADFSHNPKYIPRLIELSNKFNLTIGSRYVKNGAIRNWPLYRKLISKTANFITQKSLSLKIKDCTAGFRCYDNKIFEKLPLDSINSNGYSFLIEFLYIIKNNGYSIGEIPIIFTDRINGKSKISKIEIFNTFKTIIRLKK